MIKKLNNLQALRAFAALSIVLVHTTITSKSYGINLQVLDSYYIWGQCGVDIFFVLSGFIMVYIQKDIDVRPAKFFLDRLTRIAPLYWVLTSMRVVLTYFSPDTFHSEVSKTGIHFFASIFFMSGPLMGVTPIIYDGWSLEYEMFFYLIITVGLLFFTKNINYLFTTVLISLLVIFQFTGLIAFEFLLGIFLGNIYLYSKNNKKIYLCSLVIGFTWLFSTLAFILDVNLLANRVIFYGLPSFFLIYGLLGIGQIKNGILTKLGDASYSIYLIQVFTIPAFYTLITITKVFNHIPSDVLAMTCLIGTSLVGFVTHILLEKPLINFFKGLMSKNLSYTYE